MLYKIFAISQTNIYQAFHLNKNTLLAKRQTTFPPRALCNPTPQPYDAVRVSAAERKSWHCPNNPVDCLTVFRPKYG
jgi:hypothetical protein